jgi:hypothetical protein
VVVLRTTFMAGVLAKLTVGVGGRGDGVTGPPNRPYSSLLPPRTVSVFLQGHQQVGGLGPSNILCFLLR